MLLLLLHACDPPTLAVPAHVGVLVVPASLELGPVGLDQVATGTVLLENTGDAPLDLSGALSGDGFSLSTTDTWTLAAGGTATVPLKFTPPDGEPRTGTLTLTVSPDQVFAEAQAPTVVSLIGTPDPDADDDGHDHVLAGGDDCDDRDATVYPGAAELWYDGTDQDCDGNDDDQDGDGTPVREDCDDTDPAAFPGATDNEFDGVDNDCDGLVDQGAVEAQIGSTFLVEYFINSSSISDRYASYIELYFKGITSIFISGWRLGDADRQGLIMGLDTLEPGQRLLLCKEEDPAKNGALTCHGTLSPWPELDPEADTLQLLAPVYTAGGVEGDRVVIDAVTWDTSWPHAVGAAVQLDAEISSADANDDPGAWCLATTARATGDLGTPGAENEACP